MHWISTSHSCLRTWPNSCPLSLESCLSAQKYAAVFPRPKKQFFFDPQISSCIPFSNISEELSALTIVVVSPPILFFKKMSYNLPTVKWADLKCICPHRENIIPQKVPLYLFQLIPFTKPITIWMFTSIPLVVLGLFLEFIKMKWYCIFFLFKALLSFWILDSFVLECHRA